MRRTKWMYLCAGLSLAWTAPSWAWGTYGHQQIADAAIDATPGEGGKWLGESRAAVVRLSITPDCEWKANRGCELPADPKLKKLVEEADDYEHTLHFFEPDAFVKDGAVTVASASALPSGPFTNVVADYVKRMTANLTFVKQFPRSRPIANSGVKAVDVAEDGTAPWRVQQLAALAVKALRENRDELALAYLGTLGHYVGDLSQPFHVTMNYDGQVSRPSAKGIHSAFESASLERLARHLGATKDPQTKMWSNFKATGDATKKAAKAAAAQFAGLKNVEQIVATLLKMTGDSFAGIAPLVKAYQATNQGNESISAAELDAFLKASVGGGRTVLDLAESRLGVGAAALAAVWRVAFEAAGRSGKGTVAFSVRTVLENYPKPTYLPSEVLEDWGNHGKGRDVATDACDHRESDAL